MFHFPTFALGKMSLLDKPTEWGESGPGPHHDHWGSQLERQTEL